MEERLRDLNEPPRCQSKRHGSAHLFAQVNETALSAMLPAGETIRAL
jgi:hypothetical protein